MNTDAGCGVRGKRLPAARQETGLAYCSIFNAWHASVASASLLRKSSPPALNCSIHGYSLNKNDSPACVPDTLLIEPFPEFMVKPPYARRDCACIFVAKIFARCLPTGSRYRRRWRLSTKTQSVIGPTRQARNLGKRCSRKNQKNHLGLGSSNGKNGHCGLANGDLK
jgi:hypothetical protein